LGGGNNKGNLDFVVGLKALKKYRGKTKKAPKKKNLKLDNQY